jgi:RNA polymerase sigma-70 factor (ECF subfamily)
VTGDPDEARPLTPDRFAAVVDAHWDAVYRMVFHLTGHRHDADELTQETFTRALARCASFKPGSNLRAWLLRIAGNLFLDECRKRRRRRAEPLEAEVPVAGDAPERNLETREQAALARAVLEELGPTTRLVFHLRVTEDLPFREIAALAGISEEAARWHMHQARQKLLARLRDPEEERA